MPKLVVHGAGLKCSEGTQTGTLSVLPVNMTSGDEAEAATVNDAVPLLNIPTFGMCKTQANPQVAAATASAQGALTPMPCVPVVVGPWSPGADGATVALQKALTKDSTCSCAWAGTIEITDPASTVDIG